VAVPSSVLAASVGQLVVIHGQSDQWRLRSASSQRELLDSFAGLDLAEYRSVYDAAASAQARLDRLAERERQSTFEADSLARAVREIEAVAPVEGEEESLPIEIERLAHTEDLRTAAEQALAALNGDELSLVSGATGLLDSARAALEAGSRRDPALTGFAERTRELTYLASDLAAEVADYRLGLESDPGAMVALQERRAALGALLRKYGATAAGVIAFAAEARERLAELDLSPERRRALAAEADRLATLRDEAAASLSAARAAAAKRLAQAVMAEMAGLGMKGARFDVNLVPLAQAGPNGADGVEFLFSAHPTGPLRPLAKGASGGELSRLMLALEVAALDPPDAGAGRGALNADEPGAGAEFSALTLVFDEVDQGVGGAAALALAERLARLALRHQVLVVTHLPQLAAAADHHLVLNKQDGVTALAPVAGPERRRELARMLAGLEESDAALEHAAELLGRDWVGQFN
jgi:DNA repair protein RecN (Recombination protein N)